VNWIDRAIAWAAPRAALSRAQARRILGAYEAADPSRLRKSRTDKRSANAQNERSAEVLRTMARSLEQNLDIAKGALDTLVANVVGTGIAPEPQIELASGEPAEELNRELLRLWDDWIYSPEVTRQFDYYSLQRTLARSWFRDGEVFAQRIIGTVAGLDHNTLVPFSIEALEADFIPFDLMDRPRGLLQGIEVDTWGKPRAYYVYKGHPGDEMVTKTDVKRVAADRMMHLKVANRLHQLRGVSVFHSVLARLDDIKEIDESERVAARVAAAMAAFIKKGTPDFYVPPTTGLDENGNPPLRSMEMVPGMIFDDLQAPEQCADPVPRCAASVCRGGPGRRLFEHLEELQRHLQRAAAGAGRAVRSLPDADEHVRVPDLPAGVGFVYRCGGRCGVYQADRDQPRDAVQRLALAAADAVD